VRSRGEGDEARERMTHVRQRTQDRESGNSRRSAPEFGGNLEGWKEGPLTILPQERQNQLYASDDAASILASVACQL
jgi:hypothetical protein